MGDRTKGSTPGMSDRNSHKSNASTEQRIRICKTRRSGDDSVCKRKQIDLEKSGGGGVSAMEKSSLAEMVAYAASCTTLLRAVNIRQTKPFAIVCGTLEQEERPFEQMTIFSDNRKIRWKDVEKAPEKWMRNRKDDLLFLQSPPHTHEG